MLLCIRYNNKLSYDQIITFLNNYIIICEFIFYFLNISNSIK